MDNRKYQIFWFTVFWYRYTLDDKNLVVEDWQI